MPRPSAQEALTRQLDAMQTLNRPSGTSAAPSALFDPIARASQSAGRQPPARFDRIIRTVVTAGGDWGVCTRYVPVPLSEQITSDGRFVPPDAYTVDGTNISFLDHPDAPQPGETVVVSYSHTGVTASAYCRYQDWDSVDMVFVGVYLAEILGEGKCSYDLLSESAQGWSNGNYSFGSNAGLGFRPAGSNRFSVYLPDGVDLGTFSSDAGQMMKMTFNPMAPLDPADATSSAASISAYQHYWGTYEIQDGSPYIPLNGEFCGFGYDRMTHFRGTDIAYAQQRRKYRSGTQTKQQGYRTLWDMSGGRPSLIWEEETRWTTEALWGDRDIVEFSYDLGGYLLEVIRPYDIDDIYIIRLSSFNGSSLTTIDEVSCWDNAGLRQIWGGPQLILFSNFDGYSETGIYTLISYGSGGLTRLRDDPFTDYGENGFPIDENGEELMPIKSPGARVNTTDTDWCLHPYRWITGIGTAWQPWKVIVDPDLDIVPYRHIRLPELTPDGQGGGHVPQAFPGDEIQPPDQYSFRWNYFSSHVKSDSEWQMVYSGAGQRSVGHGVRTERDHAWRLGFRGIRERSFLLADWAALTFDPDYRDVGISYTDTQYYSLVNLAKGRP
jgi:hypothetical protein